jgi:hypothetical protein
MGTAFLSRIFSSSNQVEAGSFILVRERSPRFEWWKQGGRERDGVDMNIQYQQLWRQTKKTDSNKIQSPVNLKDLSAARRI